MAAPDAARTSLLTTTDHLRLGRLLCVLAGVFAAIGGLEAMMLRVQLIEPESRFLAGATAYQLLTLHGTTMVLLGLLPFWTGLGFALVPLQIGARQLAFPRLAALSVWLWLAGALLVHAWLPLGGLRAGPGFGWTGGPAAAPGVGAASWLVGVALVAIALGLAGANLVTTVLRLRAPGLGALRVPAFSVATFFAQLAGCFVLCGLAWAALQATLEMGLAPEPAAGFPDWPRLVRLGAHPEIWLLLLPALGIVSEVVTTCAGRRPLLGPAARIALAAIGVLALGAALLGAGDAERPAAPRASAALVGVWGLATLLDLAAAGRGLRLRAALGHALFALGLVAAGGLVGLAQAGWIGTAWPGSAVTVGHLHLLLSGAALLAAFAACAHWWPKLAGACLGESAGWVHAVCSGLATSVAFGALAASGSLPRRAGMIAEAQWSDASTLASLASFALAGSTLVFVWNAIASRARRAPADPWDAGTLEWAAAPDAPRFARSPRVSDAYPLWQEKHETRPEARWQRHWGPPLRAAAVPTAATAPLVLALGIAAFGAALLLAAARWPGAASPAALLLAGALGIAGVVLWAREPGSVRLGVGDGAADPE